MPSPAVDADGREVILVRIQDNLYAWFDATVENGETFDYKTKKFGNGNQLVADEEDFPTFALHGIHSDKELANTKIITGQSVSQITVDGRPGRSSGAGFMTADETILSVLWNDNKTVQELDLTHPDLAMDSLISTTQFIPEKLVNLYKQSGTLEETRWRIVFVLGHRIRPESIPLLVEALKDPEWLIYNEAAVGLSRIASEKVIPRMKELLDDPGSQVRSNALWVIGNLKD